MTGPQRIGGGCGNQSAPLGFPTATPHDVLQSVQDAHP